MARTAREFCSRESMFQSQIEQPSPGSLPQLNPDAMTWQQKDEYGLAKKADNCKPKRARWQPLSYQADDNLQAPTNENDGGEDNWSVQKVELPIVSPGMASRDPGNTQIIKKNKKKFPRRNKKKKANHSNMHDLPERAYVPPHCRKGKQKAADNAERTLPKSAFVPPHLRSREPVTPASLKQEQKPDTPIATISTVSSAKSRIPEVDKVESSPLHVDHSIGLPVSPPTTRHGSQVAADLQNVTRSHNAATSYDLTTPKSPPAAQNRARWTRAPNPRGQWKKHVWPKARDMKPPSDNEDDGGVAVASNSDGDPDYDVKKLMDWNGNWMPPPEDWADRRGFNNRHFGNAIEQWMNGHSKQCIHPMDISSPAFRDDKTCKELVPKYWTLPTVDQKSLGEFWKSMPTCAPAPISDIDVMANPPYWERYEDATHYVRSLEAPEARIDPKDPEYLEFGPASLACTNLRLELFHRDKESARRRKQAREMRQVSRKPLYVPHVVIDDKLIRPDSNVYLRPVQPADVQGIADIYNWYIDNSICAREFAPLSMNEVRQRIDAITTQGLPFLVAISRGGPPIGNPRGVVRERIAGYVCLSDYDDQSSMYRYTFETELYVHPGFRHQKIAQCLLDKLLTLVSPGYKSRGAYEYRNDFEYLKTGFSRVVKTIKLNANIEHGEMDNKVAEYLKAFRFIRAGHIQKIGYKKGKVVDVFFYQHNTSEDIDVNGIPTLPLRVANASWLVARFLGY